MARILAAGALCFVWAWLLPNHYPPWVNFHSEALSFLGLGLFAVVECQRMNAGTVLRLPQLPIAAIFSVICCVWIQFLCGIGLFIGDALLISLFLFGLAVSVSLGYRYATVGIPNANLKWIFFPLSLAAFFSAAIGLLQWLDLEGMLGAFVVEADVGDRPFGNLGQPNQLATLLLMGIVSLAWAYTGRALNSFVCILGVFFLTLVLALTQSRAGMIGAVAASIFLAWKTKSNPLRLPPWVFLVWLAGYAVLLFLPKIYDPSDVGSGRTAASFFFVNDRYVIWGQALAAITQAPWLGYGWLQTPAAQAVGSLLVPGAVIFTFSHNIVLDMLLWNGIPIGLFIAGGCAYWFFSRLRFTTQTHAVYAMGALLPVLVHSMVEYPFAYSYFLLAAGFLGGVVEAAHPRAPTNPWSVKWVVAGFGVSICMGLTMAYDYFRLEADYRWARMVSEGLEQATPDQQLHPIFLLTQLEALVVAVRVQPSLNMSATDLETMRQVLQRFSNREVHLNYILALGLNGNASEAIRQLAILRATFGVRSFKLALFVLRRWENTYPELALVRAPS